MRVGIIKNIYLVELFTLFGAIILIKATMYIHKKLKDDIMKT
jgi:hypothetical protein